MTQRQSEIIQESLKLIADKGIQGFTIKNLANAIGVTEPAIYRHFENKQKILVGILSLFKENKENFIKDVQSEDATPLDKLKSVVDETFGLSPLPHEAKKAIAATIRSEEALLYIILKILVLFL